MFEKIVSQIKKLTYIYIYLLTLGKNILNIKKEYNFIKNNQFKSIEQNLLIQKERLYLILYYAINYIPYYKRIAQERNIKISKSTIFNDIKKFPILTKEEIRKNWDLLHPNLTKFKYMLNTSGGTTGEPITLIQDLNFFLKKMGATIIYDENCGYHIGDKLVYLWGSERDIFRNNKWKFKDLVNILRNHYFLNAFKMSDIITHQYINKINQLKPKVILAYVQSIYEMAMYIKRKNLKIIPLNSLITTAGDLSKELRTFLEETFKCKVFNRYGSREVGIIATSCEKSNKLHINMYQQYIEILDDNNNELKEHEKGNIIITSLINYGLPLIRYKIGDIGSLDYSPCLCGRGLIRLNNVYGRIIDVFKNKKGDLIYGDYFTHLFYFKENIKMFQVVQEKIDEITINIIMLEKKQKRLDQSVEKDFKDKIKIVMGNDCKINFNYVNYINPSRSGKYIYTISKIYKQNLGK